MNHCPVYAAVGGHAYGAFYPGPMGSVLTPAMTDLKGTKDLPNACTLNGRCKEVCPVNIPLPEMLRSLRVRQFEQDMPSGMAKWALRLWAELATRPALYRLSTSVSNVALRTLARGRGKITSVPLAGGWTKHATCRSPRPALLCSSIKRGGAEMSRDAILAKIDRANAGRADADVKAAADALLVEPDRFRATFQSSRSMTALSPKPRLKP